MRVVWWVAIAGVLVGIGLTDAFRPNRAAIYGLGGAAAAPGGRAARAAASPLARSLRRRVRGARRPRAGQRAGLADRRRRFSVRLHLSPRGGRRGPDPRRAGWRSSSRPRPPLAYLGQLALSGVTASTEDLLRVGINLGSLWLLAYLAGVYASAERRVRAQVLELSQSDSLTGLYNRGQLFPRLEQEVQRTRRSGRGFCLLMIDLDGLKAINDSMGHLRGDEVLRSVGRVITGSIRGVDAAYRYGGDEFLILLPETEFVGAYVVAEKIREGVEEIGASLGSEEASTSVSIGLVSHPEDGWSTEELMIAADRAMYQAKSLGKNQISGNPRPRRTGPRRLLPAPEEVEPADPRGRRSGRGSVDRQRRRPSSRGRPTARPGSPTATTSPTRPTCDDRSRRRGATWIRTTRSVAPWMPSCRAPRRAQARSSSARTPSAGR